MKQVIKVHVDILTQHIFTFLNPYLVECVLPLVCKEWSILTTQIEFKKHYFIVTQNGIYKQLCPQVEDFKSCAFDWSEFIEYRYPKQYHVIQQLKQQFKCNANGENIEISFMHHGERVSFVVNQQNCTSHHGFCSDYKVNDRGEMIAHEKEGKSEQFLIKLYSKPTINTTENGELLNEMFKEEIQILTPALFYSILEALHIFSQNNRRHSWRFIKERNPEGLYSRFYSYSTAYNTLFTKETQSILLYSKSFWKRLYDFYQSNSILYE